MTKLIIKIILLALLINCLLMSISCEYGIEIVKIEMGKFPHKIVYIAGIDNELNLSGSTIFTTIRQGDIIEDNINDVQLNIKSNIDFNVPGVYEVELTKTPFFYYRFAVQVIDKSYFENNY